MRTGPSRYQLMGSWRVVSRAAACNHGARAVMCRMTAQLQMDRQIEHCGRCSTACDDEREPGLINSNLFPEVLVLAAAAR